MCVFPSQSTTVSSCNSSTGLSPTWDTYTGSKIATTFFDCSVFMAVRLLWAKHKVKQVDSSMESGITGYLIDRKCCLASSRALWWKCCRIKKGVSQGIAHFIFHFHSPHSGIQIHSEPKSSPEFLLMTLLLKDVPVKQYILKLKLELAADFHRHNGRAWVNSSSYNIHDCLQGLWVIIVQDYMVAFRELSPKPNNTKKTTIIIIIIKMYSHLLLSNMLFIEFHLQTTSLNT